MWFYLIRHCIISVVFFGTYFNINICNINRIVHYALEKCPAQAFTLPHASIQHHAIALTRHIKDIAT